MGVAITKSELQQYRSLVSEIKELQEQLELSEKITKDRVKGSSPDFPYIYQYIEIEGINSSKYFELEELIKNKLKELINKRIEIEKFIFNIDDSIIRRIFYMRYIKGYTWLKISMQLGSSDESYSRKLHENYLIQSVLSE